LNLVHGLADANFGRLMKDRVDTFEKPIELIVDRIHPRE